jgi:hypothetical protein
VATFLDMLDTLFDLYQDEPEAVTAPATAHVEVQEAGAEPAGQAT